MRRFLLVFFGLAMGLVPAQPLPGPALAADAGAARHSISPDIYGINFYWDLGEGNDPNQPAYLAAGPEVRATMRRWGGSSCSEYHWQFDVSNVDTYWFFEILPDLSMDASKLPDGSYFNQFADQARTTGGKILSSVAALGWLPKARARMCSFSVAQYGPQCKVDPNPAMACGNGIVYDPACGDPIVVDGKTPQYPVLIRNDPNDDYAWHDQSFQAEWIQYLLSRYGKGNQGGVAIWDLDNEPIWWDTDHRDIHPNPYTYDELLDVDMRYALAIKQADPTALVAGPVGDNWASLWFSKADVVAGWSSRSGNYWSNPVDRNAHGGVALLPWYLQQFQNYERQNGTRLLDYLDQHAYLAPANVAFAPAGNSATQALRLRSTRVFWDPNYIVSGDYWIRDVNNGGAPVAPYFIPRLRQTIDQNYPGTKLAITEYNWGALDDINGGLAQADLLGIFGREGLDMAALWDPGPVPMPALFSPPTSPGLKPTDPGAFAFKIYRNYDGIGGAFGETSVQATTANADQLSIFAAQRSDAALTVLVLNKITIDLSSTVSIANFTPAGAAQVWRYSQADLGSIVRQPDAALSGGAITATFPAYSMTLFVIPAAQPGPTPTVAAVTNAASYGSAIAPGQMVDVWGTGMGPATLASLALDSNGMVSTSVAGVRILFDGVPAPLVFVSATQCAAVVPYFGAHNPTTHVQVEYQGVRSAPLQVAVSPTAPGLFTAKASGTGQGSILNQDNTVNSVANPASRGSVVVLWATGEGVTDPPGVDGRLAADVLPAPLAAVTVDIGGQPATVQYVGAAPGMMPGVLQINAQMSQSVPAAGNVPVRITVGGVTSQDGVTLAVR